MADNNLIVGFMKVRNSLARGNLYRVLLNMQTFCDDLFVCDDASWDGTHEYLQTFLPDDHILRIPPEDHDFAKELHYKQKLLDMVHKAGPWQWVMWMDDDEVLDANGVENLRNFLRSVPDKEIPKAFAFHYTQLWRNASWARVDEGFDKGKFIKLWRWNPGLEFNIVPGTHHAQFPNNIVTRYEGHVFEAPFEIIHYGNYGPNLKWKCIQYSTGLGGVDRHLLFDKAEYRPVPKELFPPQADHIYGDKPKPFTKKEVAYIRGMGLMKDLKDVFCVIIPSYNRAHTLPRALDSLINQTYDRWVAFVLDDGSTDETEALMHEYQEKDQRIFYIRYLERRGGVAMNEIGMDIACQVAEWWSRLGSDDWFDPKKLEYDAKALKEHEAVYGPFSDVLDGEARTVANAPVDPRKTTEALLKGFFQVSWANCAVNTKVLKKVHKRFGDFCNKELFNMEDFLVNSRIARFADWHWRGAIDGKFVIHEVGTVFPPGDLKKITPDAYWNVNRDGASADIQTYNRDQHLTIKCIHDDDNKEG